MNVGNINNSSRKLKILVAPLDWGLGHATRCIPIIKALINQDAEVILAGEGAVVVLLQAEFPTLKLLKLPGYRISYSKNKKSFSLKILAQIPGILLTISNERRWLKKVMVTEKFDGVISDNRFGLYDRSHPCVYITHQLNIQTGNSFLNKIITAIHYRYINRFSECWVPDMKDNGGLAGKLSHPISLPSIPVHYIGILSRFKQEPTKTKYDFLLLLSGPEPQRSLFENRLLEIFKGSKYKYAMVRGLPSNAISTRSAGSDDVYEHLSANDLGLLIQSSEKVIARAGYSTIMDLVTLQKHAILVPTPGQKEQEYLAVYLSGKNVFTFIDQEDLSINKIDTQDNTQTNFLHSSLKTEVIISWLKNIEEKNNATYLQSNTEQT